MTSDLQTASKRSRRVSIEDSIGQKRRRCNDIVPEATLGLPRRVSVLEDHGLAMEKSTSSFDRIKVHMITPNNSALFDLEPPSTLPHESPATSCSTVGLPMEFVDSDRNVPHLKRHYDGPVSKVNCLVKNDVQTETQVASAPSPVRIFFRRLLHDVGLLLGLMAIAVISLQAIHALRPSHPGQDHLPDHSSCIYVSGGGFSGFWFSLGRLQSRPLKNSDTFVCYSSGCLGVVSTLTGQGMMDLYKVASELQNNWQIGELHRYHVVGDFVDRLLEGHGNQTDWLNRLHIVTSVPSRWGFDAVVQRATSVSELRHLLLQTTWIPLAIGNDFLYHGHLDGAFSTVHHPTCATHVGLAANPSLLANIVNVNVGREAVDTFYQMGLDYGL